MDRNEVQRRIVKVTCHVLGVEAEMVKPESHFVFDLGAESTQSVELVAGFEGGRRDGETPLALMADLSRRVARRLQLTTDGFRRISKASKGLLGTLSITPCSSRDSARRSPAVPGTFRPRWSVLPK